MIGGEVLSGPGLDTDIPVAFLMAYDPVEVGVVASLNRPSGNLTVVTTFGTEITGKRVEMLHKLVPAADPIAYLNRTPATDGSGERGVQTAAGVLGLRLLTLFGSTESEIAAAFATIVEQRAGALLISSGAYSPAAMDQVLSLARRYAVPTLFFQRDRVVRGGLASYGVANGSEGIVGGGLVRQMGVYTGRILKGEKPADLPVIQPTKFDLVINLKTAKALGLTIPETLLATADEVIQ